MGTKRWLTRTVLPVLRHPAHLEKRGNQLCPAYPDLLPLQPPLIAYRHPWRLVKGNRSWGVKEIQFALGHQLMGPVEPIHGRLWMLACKERLVSVRASSTSRVWKYFWFLILPAVLLCANSTSFGVCMCLAVWNVFRSPGSTQNCKTRHLCVPWQAASAAMQNLLGESHSKRAAFFWSWEKGVRWIFFAHKKHLFPFTEALEKDLFLYSVCKIFTVFFWDLDTVPL